MAKKDKINSFIEAFNKKTEKMDGVSSIARPPELFFDTGNCIINKLISGKYSNGYPEGRMSMLAGLSSTGKSFLVCNAIKQALSSGYGVLTIDTENALDTGYLANVGVDHDNPLFSYKSIDAISTATKITSDFFNLYENISEEERVPYLITLDSLDQMMTDSEVDKSKKGETGGDMGQRAKQLKAFQSTIMHRIKQLPIAVVCTKQTYMNTDSYTAKREPTVITPSLRFAYTQILVLNNKPLKNKLTNSYDGINLEVFANKTRLTKPYQQCVVEVPYDSGMDWYSGVLQAAESVGIVKRNGAWYSYGDTKFQRKTFDEHKENIFQELLKEEEKFLEYEIPEEDLAA
jgi:recombination protein RecA